MSQAPASGEGEAGGETVESAGQSLSPSSPLSWQLSLRPHSGLTVVKRKWLSSEGSWGWRGEELLTKQHTPRRGLKLFFRCPLSSNPSPHLASQRGWAGKQRPNQPPPSPTAHHPSQPVLRLPWSRGRRLRRSPTLRLALRAIPASF